MQCAHTSENKHLLEMPQHVGSGEQHGSWIGNVSAHGLGKWMAGTLCEENHNQTVFYTAATGGVGGCPAPSWEGLSGSTGPVAGDRKDDRS